MKLKSDEQAAARALISMPLPPKDMKAELQKVRDEENLKYRMQLAGMRKETAMALIREKEACIKLLQTSPDQIRGKIEILNRQKDQLRHKLLTQDSDFSTLDQPTLGFIDLIRADVNMFRERRCKLDVSNENALR